PVVAVANVGEQTMMVDPHDQNREEAGHEREVGRPLICERLCERCQWRQVTGHLDVEDQKSDGDCKYAIAECLDSRRFVEAGRHRGSSSMAMTDSSRTPRGARRLVRFAVWLTMLSPLIAP